MFKLFSKKVFGAAFAITIGIVFAIALEVPIDQKAFTLFNAVLAVIGLIAISTALAAIIASYRYPLLLNRLVYRGIMRRLAKIAIRSSLSHAMTRIECLGILDNNGTVALRIEVGASSRILLGQRFNVYDVANDQLWGRVVAVEIDETTSLSEPFDRVNPDFWEHLEDRMRFDTSPPNVYLVQEWPTDLLEILGRLLDNWR